MMSSHVAGNHTHLVHHDRRREANQVHVESTLRKQQQQTVHSFNGNKNANTSSSSWSNVSQNRSCFSPLPMTRAGASIVARDLPQCPQHLHSEPFEIERTRCVRINAHLETNKTPSCEGDGRRSGRSPGPDRGRVPRHVPEQAAEASNQAK